MNKSMMWILVLVALLVGAFGGYYFEKNKMNSQLVMLQQSMQQQIDQAKMAAVTPTGAMANITMMSKGVLTDSKGMTLYTFDKDTQNTSNCSGTCATVWPPFVASGTVQTTLPAHMGTTKRSDGAMQYTYNGMPLYYYSKDTKPGDMNGDGFGGIWHVIK